MYYTTRSLQVLLKNFRESTTLNDVYHWFVRIFVGLPLFDWISFHTRFVPRERQISNPSPPVQISSRQLEIQFGDASTQTISNADPGVYL